MAALLFLPLLPSIMLEMILTFGNTDANLDYRRTFAKDDQSLEISLNSSRGNISWHSQQLPIIDAPGFFVLRNE